MTIITPAQSISISVTISSGKPSTMEPSHLLIPLMTWPQMHSQSPCPSGRSRLMPALSGCVALEGEWRHISDERDAALAEPTDRRYTSIPWTHMSESEESRHIGDQWVLPGQHPSRPIYVAPPPQVRCSPTVQA